MYVQYQVPAKKLPGAYPVIMVHGGSHMGQSYDTTPDGREGWRTLFLRHGFPVYIVDQPGVARSSFNPSRVNQAVVTQDASVIPAVGMRISTLEQIWSFYRFGPQYPTLHPGSQFPAEALTQYLSQMVPNTDGFLSGPSATVRIEALAELLDKIGPAILITHSASGPHGFAVVPQRPGLVKALISIEPAGCSVPAANRPAFVGVPTLILFGDFTTGSTACQNTANALIEAGGDAAMVLLPSVGISGNSHMLLFEKNNDEIARFLVDWIVDKVE
jgi:pimeloyl-ACP methyl ester carboxylesterase